MRIDATRDGLGGNALPPGVLEPADWTFPVPIRYGPGRIAELGPLGVRAGMRRPLIVTDRGSGELPFVGEALASLSSAGMEGAVFSGISPNPTDRDVTAGRDFFRDGGHDAVIAIGGGSGMDGAKAISLIARNRHHLLEFDYDHEPPASLGASDFVPLVCVPTTAGTGAETKSTAMVTDPDRGVKICVWHPAQKPAAVILDPQLTVSLPKTLTAWTGCDALVHAIEALSVPQWHPLCDGLALEAMRLIGRSLPVAVRDGTNLEARGAMLAGSCLAGVSFLKGLGWVHAISHMVWAVYDTHHGLTNAVLLPLVLRYNRSALGEKTAQMCRAMGLAGEDFEHFYTAIVSLLNALEIPPDLQSLGVMEERAPEIARKAHADASCATNPVPATVEQIETLVRQAIREAR
ncbi:MAG: iron-containing alcohol dehydrogenase [Gammaproteobacteria bacterium]